MAYGDFKGLTRRTNSEKYCVMKHLILLKFQKNDGFQRGLASIVYKLF